MNEKKSGIVFILVLVTSILLTSCGEQADFRYAENGHNDTEWLERYQAYLDKYPDGKYVAEATGALGYVYMRMAVRGEAIETAQEYDTENAGSNKIYIIKVTEHSDGHIQTSEHPWNELLPTEKKAGNLYDASIYCIVSEGDHIKVDSKRYSNGVEVFGYMVMTDIELREAKTGRILFSTTLEGSKPLFPYSIKSNTQVIKGSPAQYFDLENWLNDTVY
jgi:hypothetical protein